MTPELKIACDIVFQEHKASSYPVTWNRDAFRGRISTGLTEMARETLLKKNIIYYPNPSKKILTVLNPAVTHADSYEEAEQMAKNGVPSLAATSPVEVRPVYVQPAPSYSSRPVTHRLVTYTRNTEAVAEIKWYLKPLFLYVVWPACAAIAGALLAYLIGTAYSELVFDLK
jgi:hypothetical protein